VDGDSTIDVSATEDGFSCFAFFPPDRLAPKTLADCQHQQGPDGTVFVVVRVEVHRQDIWLIAENVHGQAQSWYADPDVISERKPAFAREQRAWLARTERRAH
jgi:hypothetical protein